jgi:hypothetical protein
VIKVDVEGHEESVIAGATETLGRDTPNLVLELEERHKEGCVERTDAQLRELGYAGLFLEGGRVCELDAAKVAARQRDEDPKTYVRNFIFVPRAELDATRRAMQQYLA